MKKLLLSLLLAAMSLSLVACSGGSDTADGTNSACKTLNVYNWGEYVGEDVIANFEDEFGVKVNYSLFDSNEAMYTKVLSGTAYDVLVPSDYMIEKLIEDNLLQPINKEVITNMSVLYEGTLNKPYDMDNTYSVPYFFGNVGIVYDKTIIDEKDVMEQEWEVMRNPKYAGEIYMYDSERDSFMIALKALGYSMNTENMDEINAAYEWLVELHKTMEPAYVTDEAIDGLINGEKAMGVMYSGDAAYILSENENMAFYAPEKMGTNYWNDAMVIPSNAKCPELANEFINYILTHDASYDNSITVGYASANKEVYEELASTEFEGNNGYKTREQAENDEVFFHNETLRKALSELWIKVKNQ